ncbi:MAG TPA: thermonuclease family protein [Kiritimatiellia bacterium]|nr:thermonuclease family protein [Kiritimatiellia bacterium]
MRKLFIALLLCFLIVPIVRAAAAWETLAGCTLIHSAYNDGDSFHVRHGDKEYIFRLYFVDAPEEDRSFPQRNREQAAYFGIDDDQIVDIGRLAKERALSFLSEPFTVFTRWHSAQGRSRIPRHYAFVRVNGKDLAEELVKDGLARVFGVRVNSPEGETATAYRARLLHVEDEARLIRRGAWAQARPLAELKLAAKRTAPKIVIAPRTVAYYSTELPRRRLGEIARDTPVRVLEEFPDGWVRIEYDRENGDVEEGVCLRWDLSLAELPLPGGDRRAELNGVERP